MKMLKTGTFAVKKLWEKPLVILMLLLLFVGVAILWDFLIGKRLFLLAEDAYAQFYPEMYNIFSLISNGEFPLWSFSKGLGQQVTVGNPNWLGDVFAWISILCGTKMEYSFGWVMLLKIVLSGLFFYLFLRELGVSPFTRVLFALIYAFNGQMFSWGLWMHYASEVVFIALWLYAMELHYKRKNLWLFPIVFALLLLSRNASYLYIYSLMTYLYMAMRFCFDFGIKFKLLFWRLVKFSPWYLCGIGISAVLLLPGVFLVLSSPRVSGDISMFRQLLFSNPLRIQDWKHFVISFGKLFSLEPYNTAMYPWTDKLELMTYVGIISTLLIPMIFIIRKNNKKHKFILIVLLLLVGLYHFSHYFRYFLNAFSSTYYKTSIFWTLISLILISVYIMECLLSDSHGAFGDKVCILPLNRGKFFYVVFAAYCFAFLCLNIIYSEIMIDRTIILIVALLLFYAIALNGMLKDKKNGNWKMLVLCLVCFEIISGHRSYIMDERWPVYNTISYQDGTEITVQELKANDSDFFRIKRKYDYTFNADWDWNHPQAQQYFGTSSYTSLLSPSILSIHKALDLTLEVGNNWGCGFNERDKLNSISSVKYYLAKNDAPIPKEYEFKYTGINDISVYENKNYIPMGYIYQYGIRESDCMPMMPRSKDDMMLNAVVLPDDVLKPSGFSYLEGLASKIQLLSSSLETYENIEIIEDDFPDGVKYRALTIDPQIILKLENPQKMLANYRFRFTIESENKSEGQIFYNDSAEGFSELKSERFDINSGKHSYEIGMNCASIASYIRFDVGNTTGEYRIEDFEIFEEPYGYKISDKPITFLEGTNVENVANNFPKSISYDSLNTDPNLYFNIDSPEEGLDYELNMKITSESDTGGQMYIRSENTGFGDLTSLYLDRFNIKKGKSDYKLTFHSDEPISQIRIDVGDANGAYTIEDIKLQVYRTMDTEQTQAAVQDLREETMDMTYFSNSHIKGNIEMRDAGFFFLSIPYDKGWHLKVDGVEKELVMANFGFCGAFLEAGYHDIALDYMTPWLIPGIVVSIISLSGLFIAVAFSKKKGGNKNGTAINGDNPRL